MLSSRLCNPAPWALDSCLANRADALLGRLPSADAEAPEGQPLKEVARDFASLFYSVLVQQMRKSVGSDEEAGPVSEGAWGFFTMFLPRAITGQPGDALTRYVHDQLSARYGGIVDEGV